MYNSNNLYAPYQYNLGAQLQRQEVVRVNGKNGADAYQMAPNSSVLLLDETAPIVWLKTTDGASYPTITGYKISPIEEKPVLPVGIEELSNRVTRLEELMYASQSNVADVKQNRPAAKKQSQ